MWLEPVKTLDSSVLNRFLNIFLRRVFGGKAKSWQNRLLRVRFNYTSIENFLLLENNISTLYLTSPFFNFGVDVLET